MPRPVARWALVLCVAGLVLSPAPAAAETSAEVRDLARQAKRDPAALDRLREVRSIDGQPADLRTALDGAEGDELDRRLDVIESEVGRGTTPSVRARDDAGRILNSDRYRTDEPPRPLRGVLRRLGEWLEPVFEPIGRLFRNIGDLTRNLPLMLLLAALVVALTIVLTRAAIRRTAAKALDAETTPVIKRRESNDPVDLEKEADAAEAGGDYDLAFRLRFRAGLLRLDKAGVIHLRQDSTTGQLVRAIRSTTFPRLARTFDEVAYGGRTPGAEEVQRAKTEWPRVLEEARR